jgi:secreted trypsin-like serine protease
VALLAHGCGGDAAAPPEGSRAQAITGGASDDVDDTAVVALSIRTQDGEEGLCTGFVVAPRLVLTAAHCVAPAAVGPSASFSLFLGSNLGEVTQTSAPENHAEVERVDYDPEFDLAAIATGHDVGVLVTASPLPAAPLSLEPSATLDGVSEVRIVGYGVSSETQVDAGRRRQAVAALASHGELFLELGAGPAPCEGDSGAPVLVADGNGGERVAGVVSFTPGGCGPGVKVTNLSTYLPFVESQIESTARAKAYAPGGACGFRSRNAGAPFWPVLALLFAFRKRTARVSGLPLASAA